MRTSDQSPALIDIVRNPILVALVPDCSLFGKKHLTASSYNLRDTSHLEAPDPFAGALGRLHEVSIDLHRQDAAKRGRQRHGVTPTATVELQEILRRSAPVVSHVTVRRFGGTFFVRPENAVGLSQLEMQGTRVSNLTLALS